MRLLFSLTVALVGCVPPQPQMQPQPAYPQQGYPPPGAATGAFAGTWVTQGGSLTLAEQNGQVSGAIQGAGLSGSVQGVAQGNQLSGTFTMPDGSAGNFTAVTDGARLSVNAGGAQPIVFTRATGSAPPEPGDPPPAPGYPPPEPAAVSSAQVPDLAGSAATGERVYDQYKGWEVRTPAHWKHGIKDGRVMFGSDTEAGAIVVMYSEHTTFEQAAAAIDGQIRALGATPVGAARASKVNAGRALIAELSGAIGGSPVMGRAVGVEGPNGMLVVLGFTSAAKLPGLRSRIDALARSTRFFTPELGKVALVSGCFRNSSGSSTTWVERDLYFDGAGHFSKNGFVSAQSTDAYGHATGAGASLESKGAGGTYILQGDKTIELHWNDGSTGSFQLEYEHGAVGALRNGNTWYLKCS